MVDSAHSPGPSRSRRRVWRSGCAALLLAVIGVIVSAPYWIEALGGASRWRAVRHPEDLSDEARALLARTYDGLDPARLVDFHTHLLGAGNGSDSWVNPDMYSPLHVKDHVRFLIYLSAAGIEDEDAPDAHYVEKLVGLVNAAPVRRRRVLLAFDFRHDESGQVDREHSEFHVPNDYMWAVCQRYPEIFVPCVSIHPYRSDAVTALTAWAERGVRFVKWLPNAMGIDPASARCDPYYEVLREHGMVLLTHTGEEQAVEADEDQQLGNPLRLRRALDAGVRVLAAHCASSGEGADLDHPGERRPNFELFLRLMDEPRYEGLLFGEISTVTQVNRYGVALATLLRRSDLHPRLVDGSDWPLPGINVLYQTRTLERAGFLSADDRRALNELYDYHPLLFDLALKRAVRAPGTGERFAAEAFLAPDDLLP